jgi:hypothetical protein
MWNLTQGQQIYQTFAVFVITTFDPMPGLSSVASVMDVFMKNAHHLANRSSTKSETLLPTGNVNPANVKLYVVAAVNKSRIVIRLCSVIVVKCGSTLDAAIWKRRYTKRFMTSHFIGCVPRVTY